MPHTDPNPPSWYEKMRGKRTKDIYLPGEGEKDPRLVTPGAQLHEAFKTMKDMRKNPSLEGLRRAAEAQNKRQGR